MFSVVRFTVFLLGSGFWLAAGPLFAQPADAENSSGVTPQSSPFQAKRQQQLQQWVKQLDADSYEARETASAELIAAGEDARPLLEAAARHPSPEVRYRSAEILDALLQKPLRDLEQEIVAFAGQADDRIDVERGMCLIARILDPHVRDQDLLKKLDEIASRVQLRLGKDVDAAKADPQLAVAALRHVVYEEYRFRGNQEDYNHPDNCSLAFVLATRKGKPVLLGQLLVAVARRLKVPLVGVPVTGQYLVKYDGSRAPKGFPRDDIYLHPFDSGKIVSRADRARDYPDHDPDRMVPPGTNREPLARLLRNVVQDLDERDDAAAPHRRVLSERMLKLMEQPAGP